MTMRGYRKGFYHHLGLFLRVIGVARAGGKLLLYVASPTTRTHRAWILSVYEAAELSGRFTPTHLVPRHVLASWNGAHPVLESTHVEQIPLH